MGALDFGYARSKPKSAARRASRAPGDRVGRYEIVSHIATGGMAEVYLARSVAMAGFERLIALKLCHPQLVDDSEFVTMFLDEARIAASIRHANVVGTLDVAQESDALYMVMEYVEGASLASLLRGASAPADIPSMVRVVVDVLRGLHAAHELRDHEGRPHNVIHRDVTPQNVLVGLDGMARLTDFGVAKAEARATVTKEGSLKGKLGYLAPEQLRGKPIDRRVDLFAAGIMLWEAVVGERLFRGTTDADTVGQILTATIYPPSTLRPEVSEALDAVVMRALAREPERRFETAEAMALALEAAVTPASYSVVGRWVRATRGDEVEARHGRLSAFPADGPTQIEHVEPLDIAADSNPDPLGIVPDVERERERAEELVASSRRNVLEHPRRIGGWWLAIVALIGLVGGVALTLLGGRPASTPEESAPAAEASTVLPPFDPSRAPAAPSTDSLDGQTPPTPRAVANAVPEPSLDPDRAVVEPSERPVEPVVEASSVRAPAARRPRAGAQQREAQQREAQQREVPTRDLRPDAGRFEPLAP